MSEGQPEPGNVCIRPAEEGDFDKIVVLELETFGRGAWSPRTVDAELAEMGTSRFIAVAVAGEEVIGWAVLSYGGEMADVQRLAVASPQRGRGLAGQLLDRLLVEAVHRGCERILLEVAADNPAAQRLYGARGFVEIAQRPRYYPGDVDAVVMELVLQGPSASLEETT